MVYHLPPNPPNRLPRELECPKCGRHTVVMHGVGRYVCLSCDWLRDLNDEQDLYGRKRFSMWLFALIVFLMIVLINRG